MSATDTATVTLIPAWARLMWLFPNYALDHSSQTGYLNDAPGSERALTTVIVTCSDLKRGIDSRRINDLVASLGINNLSNFPRYLRWREHLI